MRAIASLLTAALLAACASTGQNTEPADILFEHVSLVPMGTETVVADQAVAVRDGRIVAIIDQAQARTISAKANVDAGGRYMMPGLYDLHVHVRWNPQAMFNLFLANGVTTVQNMGLADGAGKIDHLKLRADIESGAMIGPRYLVSGPQLHEEQLPDVSAVDPMLDRHVAEGYDLVKVHGDLPVDVYEALIAGAHERGLRIAGHSQHQMPEARTLELDTMEHVEEFLYFARDDAFAGQTELDDFLKAYRANVDRLHDPAYRALVIGDFAASDVFVDCTLIVYKMIGTWASDEQLTAHRDDLDLAYLPEDVRDRWLSLTDNPYQDENFPITVEEIERNVSLLKTIMKELNEADVPLLLGTDSFGTLVPGKSAHQELALMVEAGLTPYEALKTGTVNAATSLGESEMAGTLAEGKRADFVLLDRNPLEDISNAQSVSGVYTHGTYYAREDLARMLEAARP